LGPRGAGLALHLVCLGLLPAGAAAEDVAEPAAERAAGQGPALAPVPPATPAGTASEPPGPGMHDGPETGAAAAPGPVGPATPAQPAGGRARGGWSPLARGLSAALGLAVVLAVAGLVVLARGRRRRRRGT